MAVVSTDFDSDEQSILFSIQFEFPKKPVKISSEDNDVLTQV